MKEIIYIASSKKEMLESDPGFARAEREGDTFQLMTLEDAGHKVSCECKTCDYRMRIAKRLGMEVWVLHIISTNEYHITGLYPPLG